MHEVGAFFFVDGFVAFDERLAGKRRIRATVSAPEPLVPPFAAAQRLQSLVYGDPCQVGTQFCVATKLVKGVVKPDKCLLTGIVCLCARTEHSRHRPGNLILVPSHDLFERTGVSFTGTRNQHSVGRLR